MGIEGREVSHQPREASSMRHRIGGIGERKNQLQTERELPRQISLDSDQMQRLQQGDPTLWENLTEVSGPVLDKIGKRYGNITNHKSHPVPLEDINQQTYATFYKALQPREGEDPTEHAARLKRMGERPLGYMIRVQHSVALNAYRAQHRQSRPPAVPTEQEFLERTADPTTAREDVGQAIEQTEGLNDVLSHSREPYRTTLRLFYEEGLQYKEIAEALGVEIGTVMSRINRGKKQIAEVLTTTEDDDE